jgi:hypothetical protein
MQQSSKNRNKKQKSLISKLKCQDRLPEDESKKQPDRLTEESFGKKSLELLDGEKLKHES